MESLAQLIDKLLETLNALSTVLTEEHHLLCSGQLPGVALQRATDAKSQLLATVNYLEQQRLNLERAQGQQAPIPRTRAWRTAGNEYKRSASSCGKKPA